MTEDMKHVSILGGALLVALIALLMMHLSGNVSRNSFPRMSGDSAKLPCLAESNCPMGQKCSDGFCSEGFMTPVRPSVDMSSCNAKECNGLNAVCPRKETPCPEGTFCQNNGCVNITAQDQGEAYGQIGMILD